MKKVCESCGMPLKDSNKGTKADGSLSERYCTLCYSGGVFVKPDATIEQMRTYSVEGMSKKGWPKFLAKLATSRMNKLPRWQQEDTSKPAD